MNPRQPYNPFSRDEYPALTDAILGVVNGQPRPVEEDVQTPERAAEMAARKKKAAQHSAAAMKQNPEGAGTAAIVNSEIDLHIKDKRERDSKKTYGKGGKVVGEAVTPAQRKVFNAERERMMTALNNPNKKLSPTEREAVLARGQRNAAAEVRKDAVSPTGVKSPVHAQAKAYHEYARKESKKMDAIAKRKSVKEDIQTESWTSRNTRKRTPEQRKRADEAGAKWIAAHPELEWRKNNSRRGGGWYRKDAPPIKESQALDERIIDEVDAFQAAKNWVKGKGFKTNREVSAARVNANMTAMQRRKARAAKKKG